MSKNEKIQLSHSVIEWLSSEITEIEHIIKKLKNTDLLTAEDREIYDSDDLDYLESKLDELNRRSTFEEKNLKMLRLG
jgi:cell division protein FtsB